MYNVGADGDRQAFPLAWKALKRPYHLVRTAPASAGYRIDATGAPTSTKTQQPWDAVDGLWCGATEVQHDLRGRPLFLHRNMDKLNKRAVRPAGVAVDAPRVMPWKTVYHWSDHEVGVWGETRLEYGCNPRSTLWLAGCVSHFLEDRCRCCYSGVYNSFAELISLCYCSNTSDVKFADYFGDTEWAQNLNAIVEDALDHVPVSP